MATEFEKKVRKNQVKHRNRIEQDEHCDDALARRVKLVDKEGYAITTLNPLPVTDGSGGVLAKVTPQIFKVDMPLADTEYMFALPLNTTSYNIKLRNRKATMKLSFVVSGTEGVEYWTISPGNSEREEGLLVSNRVLYFQSNIPNNTLEIKVWTL